MDDAQHYEKLAEVMYDIRDRVIRIEERQNRMDTIEARADDAHEIATSAQRTAADNAKDIDQMSSTAKWLIGLLATGFFTESAAIIGLFTVVFK